MASSTAKLLGIDDGEDDDAPTPRKAATKPATVHEFQKALDMLGIKDEPTKVSPGGVPIGENGRPRVTIRKPSLIDTAPEPARKAAGYANQVVEGVPLVAPATDLAASAIDATAKGFGQGDPNPYGATWMDRFTSARNKLTGATKEFAAENPIGSTVANVAGGVASAIPLAMTGPGAIMMGLRGPSLGLRTLGGGAGGATIGGADAALRGDNIGTGALLGGGVGMAGPVAGDLAHKGTSAALNYFLPRQGPLKGIDPINVNRLVQAVEGETPATIAAARDRIGPHGFLGDLNQGMTDLTGAAAVTPGPKAVVREAYQTRMDNQRPRIEAAADAGMGTPRRDMVELEYLTTEAQKAAASPLYNQWTSMRVPPTERLKDLIPRLKNAGAFKRAEKLAAISGEPVNIKFFTGGPQKDFPTAQTWDYVKQGLDSSIEKAYSSGDKTLARKLIGLKNDMIHEIETTDAGKVWNTARKTFADYASLKDNHAAGYDTFLGGRSGLTVDELKHELRGLSVPEIQARVIGARAAISDAMGAALTGDTQMRNKLLAPNNQEKLRLLIGNNKQADEMIKALEQEHLLGVKALDVMGNNATGASNVGRAERKNLLMPNPAPEWGFDIGKPGTYLPPSIRDQFTISGMINARRGERNNVANNQLGHLLTMPNGPQMIDLIRGLSNEEARQAKTFARTRAGGNLLTGAVSGPGASVVRRKNSQSE